MDLAVILNETTYREGPAITVWLAGGASLSVAPRLSSASMTQSTTDTPGDTLCPFHIR